MSDKPKRNALSLRAIEGQLMPEEQTFQARLRQACFDGIKESEVTDVVKQIVTKAKEGDAHSQKLFFDYLLGMKNKPTRIEVHNHYPDVSSAGKKVEEDARAARDRTLAAKRNGSRVEVEAGNGGDD
jgi:hypothetical protein